MARKTMCPEVRFQQKSWNGFDVDESRRPDEMEIHLFGYDNLPAEHPLIV